jgi:hypothetical protein
MNFRNTVLSSMAALSIFISACQADSTPAPTASPTKTPARPIPTPRYDVPPTTIPTVTLEATETPLPAPTVASTSTGISNDPDNAWMTLPVLPTADENVREIYELGQTLGNDPTTFSIFGDCQARPEEFFGVFETDPLMLESLPPELRQTVLHFNGSFNRESPTAQDGTTPGALLWTQWHRGRFGCTFAETPVECELRIHKPSFVIIQIGSHFESRNTEYLRRIITQLIENGVVPILATKADNRELDHRVNRDMALLADEFNLPLWNFWAALNDLPNRGLYTHNDRPLQGDIYLTEDAQEIQRMTGLAALNIVWRAATGN